MASTFAGQSLFDSGPHRFMIRPVGRLVRGPFFTPLDLPYSTNEGKLELAVRQIGRLTASTNADLWTLMDAIQTRAELPLVGTLVDHHGRSWTGLTLVAFRPADRIDRGRVFSVAYRCDYLRFGP